MISRAPHLPDDRLFDGYCAERRGEALEPPVAEHLSDCESCNQRFVEVGQFMLALREEADAELDALFPPEKLRAERYEIMRRLEHVGRAARVISFPGQLVGRHIAAASRGVASRWVAVAAAAGLFVGVAAGMFFHEGSRYRQSLGQFASARSTNGAKPAHLAPSPGRALPQANFSPEDDFMSALELSLDRPRTLELLPFDALTPHVREIRDVR